MIEKLHTGQVLVDILKLNFNTQISKVGCRTEFQYIYTKLDMNTQSENLGWNQNSSKSA